MTEYLLIPIFLLVAGVAYLAYATLTAVRASRTAVAARMDSIFRQSEALQGLYLDLGFTRSLPPTRGWAGSPDYLAELAGYVQRNRPAAIVECGSGVSTLIIARALQLNGSGHVHTLEHSPEHGRATRALLERHGVEAWATVVDAPLRDHAIAGETWPWYSINGLPGGAIDLIVVDGPPKRTRRLARYPAMPLLGARLAATGAVVVDDADRPDEREIVRRWKAEHPGFTERDAFCEKGCVWLLRGPI